MEGIDGDSAFTGCSIECLGELCGGIVTTLRRYKWGSIKSHLQLLAVKIAEVFLCSRVSVFPVWMPRGENTVADGLSRRFQEDCDAWRLYSDWFIYLSLFGDRIP